MIISLETTNPHKRSFEKLLNECSEECTVTSAYSFGAETLTTILVTLTEVTIPFIAGILIANKNNNKVIVRKDGMDITIPLTKKGLKKIKLIQELQNILDEENKVNK